MLGPTIWLTLAACTSDSNDDPEVPVEGPESPSASSPPWERPDPGADFVPADIFFSGFGLYNPEQDEFAGTTQGNGFAAQSVGVLFQIVELDEPYRGCDVLISPLGGRTPAATWTDGTTAIRGFELVPGETEVTDGCAGLDLPPEYAEGLGPMLAKWTWGFGVGVVDDETADLLESLFGPAGWAENEPYVLGSVLFGNALTVTDLESAIYANNDAYAFEVDDNGVVLPEAGTDFRQRLEADELIVSSDELARGYVEFYSFLSVSTELLTFDVP